MMGSQALFNHDAPCRMSLCFQSFALNNDSHSQLTIHLVWIVLSLCLLTPKSDDVGTPQHQIKLAAPLEGDLGLRQPEGRHMKLLLMLKGIPAGRLSSSGSGTIVAGLKEL